jgi:hypothetical protein
MYKAGQGAEAGADQTSGDQSQNSEVTDVDFEEVKDDK